MIWRVVSAALLVLVVASALAVIYYTHEHHLLYSELQQLDTQRHELEAEREETDLAFQSYKELSRIDRVAREQLGMTAVPPDQEIIIRQID